MSHDDDADFVALGRALPTPDVDATTAQRIALRARVDLGKGPPRRRFWLPILVGVPAAIYAAWAIAGILDIFT